MGEPWLLSLLGIRRILGNRKTVKLKGNDKREIKRKEMRGSPVSCITAAAPLDAVAFENWGGRMASSALGQDVG